MAGGLPGVVIQIGAQSAEAVREIDKTNKALGGLGSSSKGAADKIRAAQGPALAALGAITAAAGVAALAASDLEQATGAATAVFGEQTGALLANAEAANRMGLSTAEYAQNAAILGALLKNTGASTDDLAGATSDLLVTASDMAAQFGGTTADAVGALTSLMKGSYEVVDNYGVRLTAADVAARAAADGTSTAEAALAILNEQLEQTGTAGAASREIGTMAQTTAEAKAAFTDASAEIGGVFLPIVADMAKRLADVAGWIAENKDLVVAITAVVGAFAAIIVVLNVAMSVYTVIQWAANTALFGFPVIWIVLAIAAVVAAVVLLYKNWDVVVQFFKDSWEAIKRAFASAADAIKSTFAGIWDSIRGFINRAIDAINRLIEAFNRLPGPDLPTIPNVRASSGGAGAQPAGARSAGARTGAGGSVTINVTTGVGDPAAIAREIRRALNNDNYRVGWSV